MELNKIKLLNIINFLGLMPDILTEASLHLSKGEEDQAGEILNNYLENMYKGGITGTDATKTYKTLIDNIYAQGTKLLDIDISKPDAAQKLALAESFPDLPTYDLSAETCLYISSDLLLTSNIALINSDFASSDSINISTILCCKT